MINNNREITVPCFAACNIEKKSDIISHGMSIRIRIRIGNSLLR